jgi:hypothetical protein
MTNKIGKLLVILRIEKLGKYTYNNTIPNKGGHLWQDFPKTNDEQQNPQLSVQCGCTAHHSVVRPLLRIAHPTR